MKRELLLAAMALNPPVLAGGALEPASRQAPSARPDAPESANALLVGSPLGPLPLTDLFPLHQSFLQPAPEAVETIATGSWRLSLQFDIANTLARSTPVEVALEMRQDRHPVTVDLLRRLNEGSGIFLIDSEDRRLRLRLERGLAGGWQIGLELPFLERGGGSLDSFGEGFHSLLGVDQDGRSGLPRNELFIYVATNPREILLDEAPGSGIGDATLSAKRTLPNGGVWRRSLDATLKLPTGDESRLMSSGSADIGLRLLGSRALARRWHLHAGAGTTYLGRWDLLRTPAQTRWNAFAAIERTHASGASTVLQLVGYESPLQSLGVAELDEESFQLSLGGYIPLTGKYRLTLAASDNVLHFDSGSDFSFHLGITADFR